MNTSNSYTGRRDPISSQCLNIETEEAAHSPFPYDVPISGDGSNLPVELIRRFNTPNRESKAIKLLRQLSGKLAEDLAHEADFHAINASKWYKVVKRARKFLSGQPAHASEACILEVDSPCFPAGWDEYLQCGCHRCLEYIRRYILELEKRQPAHASENEQQIITQAAEQLFKWYGCEPNEYTKEVIKAAIEKAVDQRNAYWQRIAKAHDCESVTDAFVELTKLRASHASEPWTVEINDFGDGKIHGAGQYGIQVTGFKINATEAVNAHNATLHPAHASEQVERLTPRQCAEQFRMYAKSHPSKDSQHSLRFAADFLDEYCQPAHASEPSTGFSIGNTLVEPTPDK